MNILMLTNTYIPHVGGVARSVQTFTEALRARGHRVVVVAPTFEDMPEEEQDVVRVPAIQQFNGSDFSVRLPIPGQLSAMLEKFRPDIVHAHHPFLLGDTALRVAARFDCPLVFTHHTMYERYTHYVPGDSETMQSFAVRMATEYANMCDRVVAPSESIAEVLRGRGVTAPVTPIPTGIDTERFGSGDGQGFRADHGIPGDALVVGHLGRLAPEKNLAFLSRAVARFLHEHPDAHFLVIGKGPSEEQLQRGFREAGLAERMHLIGELKGQSLIDAYHAMDLFAFASQSETQGMVLAEAMAAGVPVVAVDAAGTREVVRDGVNGALLESEDDAAFVAALTQLAQQTPEQTRTMVEQALRTAEQFSVAHCTERLEALYAEVAGSTHHEFEPDDNAWAQTLRRLRAEWQLWSSRSQAAIKSIGDTL